MSGNDAIISQAKGKVHSFSVVNYIKSIDDIGSCSFMGFYHSVKNGFFAVWANGKGLTALPFFSLHQKSIRYGLYLLDIFLAESMNRIKLAEKLIYSREGKVRMMQTYLHHPSAPAGSNTPPLWSELAEGKLSHAPNACIGVFGSWCVYGRFLMGKSAMSATRGHPFHMLYRRYFDRVRKRYREILFEEVE